MHIASTATIMKGNTNAIEAETGIIRTAPHNRRWFNRGAYVVYRKVMDFAFWFGAIAFLAAAFSEIVPVNLQLAKLILLMSLLVYFGAVRMAIEAGPSLCCCHDSKCTALRTYPGQDFT